VDILIFFAVDNLADLFFAVDILANFCFNGNMANPKRHTHYNNAQASAV